MKLFDYIFQKFFQRSAKYINHRNNLMYGDLYLRKQHEKLKGQLGIQNFISQIRILYPRSNNRADLSVSDLFSVILWDVLETELDKKHSIKIKIDRNTYSDEETIMNDIRRTDCLIIIVLTKEGLNKEKHPFFCKEIEECGNILTYNKKRKILFMPLLLCLLDSIDEDEGKIYNIIAKHNLERVEDFCALSLNNGFNTFRIQILNAIKRRIKDANGDLW